MIIPEIYHMQIHGYVSHILVKGVTECASIQPNLSYHEWMCIFILLNEQWKIHEPNVNNEKLPEKNLSTLFNTHIPHLWMQNNQEMNIMKLIRHTSDFISHLLSMNQSNENLGHRQHS